MVYKSLYSSVSLATTPETSIDLALKGYWDVSLRPLLTHKVLIGRPYYFYIKYETVTSDFFQFPVEGTEGLGKILSSAIKLSYPVSLPEDK